MVRGVLNSQKHSGHLWETAGSLTRGEAIFVCLFFLASGGAPGSFWVPTQAGQFQQLQWQGALTLAEVVTTVTVRDFGLLGSCTLE